MKLRVFEAFSGIGAQNLALKQLKEKINTFEYKIIGTSDWDIYSTLSYAAIHYPKFNFNKEIDFDEINNWFNSMSLSLDGKEEFSNWKRFNENELKVIYNAYKITNNIGTIINSFENVKNKIEFHQEKIDLLTYSFPCQDLSSAGTNMGIKEGTRSGLLLEIEKLLKIMSKHELIDGKVIKSKRNNENLLPKFLLLENVINLVQKTHRSDFDKWLKKLNTLGYKTIWGKINSHDYGMVQARRRVFAISIYDPDKKIDWKNNRDDLNDILHSIYENDFKPKWIQTHRKIFDFDNKFKDESILSQMKETPSRIKMLETNKYISKNFYEKISTVTTKQDRNPNSGHIDFFNKRFDKEGVPYLNKRFITPRESYYLMGFGRNEFNRAKKMMEEFTISDPSMREKLYKQAGNSIAVNILELIFYYIQKGEY